MQQHACPHCLNDMCLAAPEYYNCSHCKHQYIMQYLCPSCEQPLQIIKGCGAINYLCSSDGLVSSSKIKFNYLLNTD